jgi:alpha-galactosidase
MEIRIGFCIQIGETRASGFFDSKKPVSSAGGVETSIYDAAPSQPAGITVSLLSEKDVATGICRRRLRVMNGSASPATLYYAHIVYELPYPNGHLSYFTSAWGSEYNPAEIDLTYCARIGTWNGRSSNGCAPVFSIHPVWGSDGGIFSASIGWSGNWQADFWKADGKQYAAAGLNKDDFFHIIKSGALFDNIDIYDGTEDPGGDAEDLAFRFRTYYKNHIRLLPEGLKDIPVCYNHWWPYEDRWINEDVFFRNAKIASDLGCTNTLLDAGWFGPSAAEGTIESMSWYQKRGDWDRENKALFPSGIKNLGKKVNDEAGIPFGIWCEIEAAGEDASLRTSRPELLGMKNGKPQGYVCMGNPETVRWALEVVKKLVEDYGATWIKIDFNLDPQGCDCTDHGHGKGDGLYAHYQGFYGFLDEVRKRYPALIIENCSSGGLRGDWGIMKHCHVMFLSDPDYTRHHLQCFWGALSHFHHSACYHFTQSETVGGHNRAWDNAGKPYSVHSPVTASTSLAAFDYMTRAVMTGIPGISQKLIEMPNWALSRLKEHIAFFKSISRDYILNGDIYRLTGQPLSVKDEGEAWCAFQLVREGGSILFVLKSDGGETEKTIRLRGLSTDSLYSISLPGGGEKTCDTGNDLMNRGLSFSTGEKEWSRILILERLAGS